jgi:hypothetical protein
MTSWTEFVVGAPRIGEIFMRRHAAAANLCMLATTRADGYPRISPMEPRVFAGELLLVGMPGTRKFADLRRDPRFCLHTATVDTSVSEGDAKLFGTVHHLANPELHAAFADAVLAEIGLDLRGQEFADFFAADITGASAVEIVDGHMEVTVWKPGEAERVIRR